MSSENVYFYALATMGAFCFAIVAMVALLLIFCVFIDRYKEAKYKGHVNATIFGVGLHFFKMSRDQNARFVANAKLAGYTIWKGNLVSVGLEYPRFIRNLIRESK